jgi:hypothetical protein
MKFFVAAVNLLLVVLLNGNETSGNQNYGLLEAIPKFIPEETRFFEQEPPDAKKILQEYDFIVVGAVQPAL